MGKVHEPCEILTYCKYTPKGVILRFADGFATLWPIADLCDMFTYGSEVKPKTVKITACGKELSVKNSDKKWIPVDSASIRCETDPVYHKKILDYIAEITPTRAELEEMYETQRLEKLHRSSRSTGRRLRP